jgi:type II secretory pathway pseudopilin PulG
MVELMIVVAIIGVLATLGVYGVRQYVKNSKTSEATTMIASIQAAQESYREETYQYLDVSTTYGALYPATPTGGKTAWGGDDANGANWRRLGVLSSGPVYFGYASKAGVTGTTPTVPDGAEFNWEVPSTGPWYVAVARGNFDGDEDYSLFLGSSFTNEIFVSAPLE